MAKIKYVEYKHGGIVKKVQYWFYCQGCGWIHAINPDIHTFNGDYDKPTFTPSLLQDRDPAKICHSYITDGKIQYLSDCFHDLRGSTIELPEIKDTHK